MTVFETGLPTRSNVSRTDVRFEHLLPTDTVTACPYKGTTSGYWSVRSGDAVHKDLAWAYDFPTRQLLPITGMVAFYNEKVDTFVDGQLLERPETHFFRTDTGARAGEARRVIDTCVTHSARLHDLVPVQRGGAHPRSSRLSAMWGGVGRKPQG